MPYRPKDATPATSSVNREAEALYPMEVLESIVTDLHRIRYRTESEQIDGRIVVSSERWTAAARS